MFIKGHEIRQILYSRQLIPNMKNSFLYIIIRQTKRPKKINKLHYSKLKNNSKQGPN